MEQPGAPGGPSAPRVGFGFEAIVRLNAGAAVSVALCPPRKFLFVEALHGVSVVAIREQNASRSTGAPIKKKGVRDCRQTLQMRETTIPGTQTIGIPGIPETQYSLAENVTE